MVYYALVKKKALFLELNLDSDFPILIDVIMIQSFGQKVLNVIEMNGIGLFFEIMEEFYREEQWFLMYMCKLLFIKLIFNIS